ncbi:MAG: T9SS type A sorting domain-containing protein [Bacteroidia bacterium]|jgi:hypothetical protein
MSIKRSLTFLALVVFINQSFAQQITWANDIACIIYSHCGSCHGSEKNITGLQLNSYQDVFNNRLAVELYTHVKTMPPVLPDDAYSHLAGNKRLTDLEIALIKEWAIGDALRGDSTQEPSPPVYTKPTATLPNPDLSVKLPDFIVPDSAGHYRRCFVLTTPFASGQKIKSVEVIPGNTAAVHGVFLYTDTSSIPAELDDADTEPGYEWYYGIGSATATPFYGWVPGKGAFTFPSTLGLKIDSGARIIVQLEYGEEAGGELDSTRINLHWDTDSSGRNAQVETWLSHELNLLNGPFEIPVDSVKTFHERFDINEKKTVLGIAPNLHGICDHLKVYAVLSNQDTLPLLAVKDWNPVWNESVYYFKQVQILPAGSVIYATATFGNTIINQHGSDDTLHDVHAGMGHDDEEMIFQFITADYENGDEGIVMDSNQHAVHYLNCEPLHTVGMEYRMKADDAGINIYPNPASDRMIFEFNKQASFKPYQLIICNLMGMEVFNDRIDDIRFEWNVSDLAPGLYIAQVKNNQERKSYKCFIER